MNKDKHTSPLACGSAMGAEGLEPFGDALRRIRLKYYLCLVRQICEVNEHHQAEYTIPEEFEEPILM